MDSKLNNLDHSLQNLYKRAVFEESECVEKYGDDSKEYLWAKCRVETLQEVHWMIKSALQST